MCAPKMPDAPGPIPQRQAMQLPDNGATAVRTDDLAKRRMGMMSTVLTGAGGLGSPPSTTAGKSTLGG